jgi:hypothetical protein
MASAKIGTIGTVLTVAGIALGSLSLMGTAANASAIAHKCKAVKDAHGSLICQCVVSSDKRKKPSYVYYTSLSDRCVIAGGSAPVISLLGPAKKGAAYASNSSTVLSVGVGTSFGISGGLVLGNSNSHTGSIGSGSGSAGGSADGGAGGIGSGGFSAGGAGGTTSSSASTN